MSGPAYHDGGGGHTPGEGGDVPRVPYQRTDAGGTGDGGSDADNAGDRGCDAGADGTGDGGSDAGGAPGGGGDDEMRPRGDFDHPTLKSLLGAWALSACSREEALAVEVHLTDCAACADEALRLRDAVRLLHQEESLDLDPLLRARVLEGCLGRRPARIPTPEWAGPYGAEAARLDALLRDLGDGYWEAPVDLRWFDGAPATRRFTVGQVIAHLSAVDGLVTRSLGLAGSGGAGGSRDEGGSGGASGSGAPEGRGPLRRARQDVELPLDPWQRTEAHWSARRHLPGATLRSQWREQSLTLMRTVSFAGRGAAELPVDYGAFTLPLQDAFLDRAFECWIHAGDIAEAVDYPYDPPPPHALHGMVDLAARLLPGVLAERRRTGLAESPARLLPAGRAGRSLRLEIEGAGGGDWYLPLDSPGATASPDEMVAHVAMDSVEFCQLAAGHVEPERAAAGRLGDRTAVRDVLYAAASLSRL
ncbi:maleylpyruvate isomerase N-terminal domain-containing protein [Actinacidiphila sp. DG2A-62]|uniref:maleylpyruvate isomerase N-terminal domain-containing protein n=1 Tax=Actinacidiphila sp. DG2A-62 TaxID=3108821 RepID=UPI002DBE25EE|nr:maleylpyruvate isomerase N-terminal domain-containing protein [Actinacidiphila sp. DG2A-62]MEC3994707.1 maleylpyruvate isomerase N-terminal domain-containing protein [Actinacidiphila sp. DG2A-62]